MSTTTVIDLCSADGLCMENATHRATVIVKEKEGGAEQSRDLPCCPRHLRVLNDHARKRAAETGFKITVLAVALSAPPVEWPLCRSVLPGGLCARPMLHAGRCA